MAAIDQLPHEPTWVPMTDDHIPTVKRLASKIHSQLPLSPNFFTYRKDLYSDGCRVLVHNDEVVGYAISHPIVVLQAMSHLTGVLLDAFEIDYNCSAPGTNGSLYYIHDVAMLKEFRGMGYGRECIEKLLEVGSRYPEVWLVALSGSYRFWPKFGFERRETTHNLWDWLKNYGRRRVCMTRINSPPPQIPMTGFAGVNEVSTTTTDS